MAVIWSFPGEENRGSNPYTATLVAELRRLGHSTASPGWRRRLYRRCDIIHLHWPQKVVQRSLLASLRSIMLWQFFLALQKARGARVVWTVHNVASHERPRARLERWWMALLLKWVDGIHALSQASLDCAVARHPVIAEKRLLVAPHWTYGDAYPRPSKSAAIPHSTVAFLGDIKDYKGLDAFLDALDNALPDDLHYVVHGKPGDGIDPQHLSDRMGQLRQRGWRLDYALERLTDQQMADRLASTGLLVLPYKSGENSGLAILAAEQGVPLLVSPLPAFAPLLNELAGPRITPIIGALSHAQMAQAFARGQAVAGRASPSFLARRAPAAVVAKISNYYLFLMDRKARSREAASPVQ